MVNVMQDHNWLSAIGFLSGIVVSIANVLQFLGGQAAGVLLQPHSAVCLSRIQTSQGAQKFCMGLMSLGAGL